ncbi:MAG: signal recognition particle-docking protein FtsY [Acidobacteria bacterium]|nr:MAG: signal recognition particle-docking protein FtsY [Acidobacteriota bacterium]REK04424.1 MAG: signal recognition particle-docking protein FtsY [Acidobacteriota bacterium]
MTHTEVIERIQASVQGRDVIDEETLEDLEETLLAADLGVATTMELVDGIRDQVRSGQARDVVRLRELLQDQAAILLLDAPRPRPVPAPRVTLVIGVNGVGKTTTIAKLAHRARDVGERVLLAAGDTFRAAAIEQLVVWGERLGVEVIRSKAGGDPAAVVFDAMQAAKARRADHVIVDTAGRLHTKSHLMDELAKIGRVIEREASEFSVQTLLVVDATNGQNAIQQAKEFTRIVPVDGLVLTKLDGTAKGGVVLAIARELRLPVLHLGVGEGSGDLVDFHARDFARALFGEP